ncbi:MAG: cupredoxin domain-containing protein [Chloroflexota bacterium]
MRLDKLPVGEAIVGFFIVVLIVVFVVARHEFKGEEVTAVTAVPSGEASPTGSAAPGQVEITMSDNKFDNTALTLAAGTDVTIPLKNNGTAVHNVHIAGPDGNFGADFCSATGADPCSDPVRLAAGATGTLTFTVPNTPGTKIPYRCDFHPTEMDGEITVQ